MEVTVALSPKQDVAFKILQDKETGFLLFGGGAGGGKTWLGCEWLLTSCLLYPQSRWFLARKELKRLMGSSFQTWLKVCSFHKIPEGLWKLNSQYSYIEFQNGARIDLLDVARQPQDPFFERFGSLEFTGGWGEEVGEWDFLAFDVLKTRIGRQKNQEFGLLPPKFLLTCNPTQNWVYRVFYKPYKEGTLPPNYRFVQALYRDNPHTAEVYEKQLLQITDPVLRARLMEGLWEYSMDRTSLVGLDEVLQIFSNPVPTGELYISADIARFGADKVVIGVWRGLDLIEIVERKKQSLVETEADIRSLAVKWGIPYDRIVVDEDGMGNGVVDHMEGIHGFVGGRSQIVQPGSRQNYKNLRSQCYFLLADAIRRHSIRISATVTESQRDSILEDLQQVRRVDTAADAPMQIAPKETMKSALGRSPDYSDMLMMRFYFELLPGEGDALSSFKGFLPSVKLDSFGIPK